jgi:hydroxyacyl-ACP dehydratase HTD2-like protein with hotdog domain
MMSKPMLARNPEFETVVRESFSRQAMMTTLGASLTLVEPGRVHIAFPKSDRFTQQNGFVHAGAQAWPIPHVAMRHSLWLRPQLTCSPLI